MDTSLEIHCLKTLLECWEPQRVVGLQEVVDAVGVDDDELFDAFVALSNQGLVKMDGFAIKEGGGSDVGLYIPDVVKARSYLLAVAGPLVPLGARSRLSALAAD
jgi:hypothetical protein